MDSQAKYGIVARGEAEIYLRMPTRADYREKIWDHAAGALIVEEAGGTVTDIMGRPLDFHHGRELSANRGVIVTNGRCHARVLEASRSRAGAGVIPWRTQRVGPTRVIMRRDWLHGEGTVRERDRRTSRVASRNPGSPVAAQRLSRAGNPG